MNSPEPGPTPGGPAPSPQAPTDVDAAVAAFEAAERRRLGLEERPRSQWVERVHQSFTRAQRPHTTILAGGLTPAHDRLLMASVRRLGYRVEELGQPDQGAFHIGKAYCDRAMCNPAYFTVGHLLRKLIHLRDVEGLSTQEIIERYICVTANGCGPCRFRLYISEYRKALRDAGFEGFRVLLFGQTLEAQESGEGGLDVNGTFLAAIIRALVLGDVINLLKYRIRPYEVEPGATDAAVEQARDLLAEAIGEGRWLLRTLLRVRRLFGAVRVDRTRVKPKVAVIGEIWGQTIEGDGNYRLQEFLEQEGAEVEVQPLTAWVLLIFWESRFDTTLRAGLSRQDETGQGIAGVNVHQRMLLVRLVEWIVRGYFFFASRLMGLKGYDIPNMDYLSAISVPHYDNMQRGGEMHMEVAKFLDVATHRKANMVVSVKPFGCMPSSGVSDGVMAKLAERHAETMFTPIETTGDSVVNAHSRLQMQLFRARRLALREVEQALRAGGLSEAQALEAVRRRPYLASALHRSPHRFACTMADLFHEVGHGRRNLAPPH